MPVGSATRLPFSFAGRGAAPDDDHTPDKPYIARVKPGRNGTFPCGSGKNIRNTAKNE
jgi:hypothetical protein